MTLNGAKIGILKRLLPHKSIQVIRIVAPAEVGDSQTLVTRHLNTGLRPLPTKKQQIT